MVVSLPVITTCRLPPTGEFGARLWRNSGNQFTTIGSVSLILAARARSGVSPRGPSITLRSPIPGLHELLPRRPVRVCVAVNCEACG